MNIPPTWPPALIPFAEAVRTVRNRGRYMQEAVPAGEGGMAAILGMALDQLQQVCADAAQGRGCFSGQHQFT